MSVKQLFDLSGRTALITGGSRGLGLAMAAALGDMGARVAIAARKAAELEEAARQLHDQGIDAICLPADIAKPDTIPGLVDSAMTALGSRPRASACPWSR